ncbi:hypothetical protein [Erythrobacter alti]|uniref:hypothetical protein n=1 Tax=Erythrobacter alti TaxID=1896145 RepID=UPI0030F406F6
MADQDHDPAKSRWMMLQAIRLGGLLLLLGGIVILSERVSGPQALGIGMIVIGMFAFFILPIQIARRWKTPSE